MRWSLHTAEAAPGKLGAALAGEQAHFLATSPPLTQELETMNSAIRASYNGPEEITQSLLASRKRAMAERPHPDLPVMVAQMKAAITAACEVAKGHAGTVNVSLYGMTNEKIGEEVTGDRVSVCVDFVRSKSNADVALPMSAMPAGRPMAKVE